MNRSKTMTTIILSLLTIALSAGIAFAQDEEQRRQQQEAERRQEQNRQRIEREQEEMIRRSREQFVSASRAEAERSLAPPKSVSALDREFITAAPKFRNAVSDYREAMSREGSVKDAVKELNRFIDVFKTYLKGTRVDAMPVDKNEFNDFSRKDLIWEALTSAERIDGNLRLAALHVQAANRSQAVTIQAMILMRDLNTDLQRLELLLSKIR